MDTILSGRWEVYYDVENRQKRLHRDTSVDTGETNTVRELYSALQDLFDESTQMDDGIPIKYATPTEYSIGIIDAGDKDPWFIDKESVEYLTGGALSTIKWARVQDSNVGIVRVFATNDTGNEIVEADIGSTVTHDDGDSGTLLDVRDLGGAGGCELWIRPATYGSANNWDSTSGDITVTGSNHVATQTAAADTGEMLWANIYSLGTLEDNTHLFIYQDQNDDDVLDNLVAYKDTTDWWGDGHIDILVLVKECGTLIDSGWITVFARQYAKTYSYYKVLLSSGGRNPIPLQTGADINNETGYWTLTGSSGGPGDFTVGDEIYVSATDKRAILTAVSGTTSAPVLEYYLIGDPLVNFEASDTVTDGVNSCTAGAPSAAGPAALSGLSITHANNNSFDIDESGTNEYYSIVIDCSDEQLNDVYEWTKYVTRRGETGSTHTDGIEGEQYLGSDYRISYTSLSGTISEGEMVTQQTTGATGWVVAHHTGPKLIILRNSRGTFGNYQIDGASGNVTGITATPITPIAAAPFGTFAGGKFFCAPGVVLNNVTSGDANNFQLVTDEGDIVTAPAKVTLTVGNTRAGDKVAVFRLTEAGGSIKKDTYLINANGAPGSSSIEITGTIAVDEPGKTAGGVIRVVDVSENVEDRYRFTGWTSGTPSTITLFQRTGTDDGGDENTLVDSGEDFSTNVKVGDIVYNVTEGTYAYITSVGTTSCETTNINSSNPVTNWNGDEYKIGSTVRTFENGVDTAYISLIDVYETSGSDGSPGSESATITFDSNVPVRVRCRHAGDIVPYEADSTVQNTGMNVNVVRTPDTVYE